MVYEHDPAVSEYQHEKHRPREKEALHILRKIASLVKPIMRQRGWRVGILTEFYPAETNLLGLNWNQGQKICLRLRYPGDVNQFLPLENITDTMLHELCHIVIGPHNEQFHKLWDQLRNEYDQLISKGYTGEGFLSEGHKLGGGRIPMHEARRRARAAAEKRKTLTAGSGQRLGGRPVLRGTDMRKVIADAVERRSVVVSKGCSGNGISAARERELVDETNKNGVRTKAAEDNADEEAIMLAYIDLVQEDERERWGDAYVPPSRENPAGSQGYPIKIEPDSAPSISYSDPRQRRPEPITSYNNSQQRYPGQEPPIPTSSKLRPTALPSRPSNLPPSSKRPPPASDSWTCDICTLVNKSTYLVCDACGTERPSPPPSPAAPRTSYTTPSTQAKPTSIRDSNSKKAVKSLMSLDATTSQLPKKPLAWRCHTCGSYTESEWMCCTQCGNMKLSS